MDAFFRLNITKLIYFLGLIFSFTNTQLHAEGFLAGTLVKTSTGYVPIEQIKKNDLVLSYDFSECCVVESKVIQIVKRQASACIQLSLNNQKICVDQLQRFYALEAYKIGWVFAKDLTRKFLLHNSNSELVPLDNNFTKLAPVLEPADVYTLTVAQYHNFFVSEQDILVHNFGFMISIATITFEGLVEWAGWATIASAVGAWVLGETLERSGVDTSNVRLEIKDPRKDQLNHFFGKKNIKKHNFDNQDPDKILKIAKQLLLEEAKKGNIPTNGEFTVSTAMQTGGELFVRCWAANKIISYSTMYIIK